MGTRRAAWVCTGLFVLVSACGGSVGYPGFGSPLDGGEAGAAAGDDGSASTCGTCSGCCDSTGACQPGTIDNVCGGSGTVCTDCTTLGATCQSNVCSGGGASSSSSSGGSSGGACNPSSCKKCVLGMASCSSAGACQCCAGTICLPD